MLQSGGSLTTRSAATADGDAGSGYPHGMRFDSKVLAGFNSHPGVFDGSVYSRTVEEVLPNGGDPTTATQLSYQLASTSAPGTFWDLSEFEVHTRWQTPVANQQSNIQTINVRQSFWAEDLTSCLLYDSCKVTVAGTEFADDVGQSNFLVEATKVALTLPNTPAGTKTVLRPAATGVNVNDMPTAGFDAVEMSDREFRHGIRSFPTQIAGPLVPMNSSRGIIARKAYSDMTQNGTGTWVYAPQNPILNANQGVLIPASLPVRIDLAKARGSANHQFAVVNALGDYSPAVAATGETEATPAVPQPAYVPTILSVRAYVTKVITTAAAQRAYDSLLSSVGHLTLTGLKATVLCEQQIPVNQNSISIARVASRRPQVIALWMTPSEGAVMDPTTGALKHKGTSPFACELADYVNATNASILPGAPLAWSDLQVRINGQRYPRDYSISRDQHATKVAGQPGQSSNSGRGGGGGSFARDSLIYRRLSQQLVQSKDELAPFLTESSMASGAISLVFINCSENESGIFSDQMAPGGQREIASIEIAGTAHAALANYPVTLTAVALNNCTAILDPLNGTASKGLGW